jgi:putative ABC transport system substrate-binding protein
LQDIWNAFQARLAELGYVAGKNLVFEMRHAAGVPERLPALAKELLALKPDLIVSAGTPATRAAIRATQSVPIIFVSAGDPVSTGLIASLARPGRNVTGVSSVTTETSQKAFDLLLELVPGARRVAYLTDIANQGSAIVTSRIEEHARERRIAMQALDGASRDELLRSFETVKRENIRGVIVGASATLLDRRDEVTQFAAREKLPVVYNRLEYVAAGALLSISIDRTFAAKRGADLADRILKGAKPAVTAVEQISSVRIVLNMKTARAAGIKIPESVRLRADEVIE